MRPDPASTILLQAAALTKATLRAAALLDLNDADLARVIAPGCKFNVSGIRPGEKLHEVLVHEDEARNTLELDDMFVVKPLFPWWVDAGWDAARKLPEGFRFSSDTNTRWLNDDELRAMIKVE